MGTTFDDFLNVKKMRDVRTIILAVVSRRDLCYVSENEGFRFAKNKLILCPFSEKMCQIHCNGCQILTSRSFLPDAYGIGPGSAPRDLPSTCAGGQDDVSSQANSLKSELVCLKSINPIGMIRRLGVAENAPSEPLDLAWPPGWPWLRGTEAEMGQGSILDKN